MDGVIYAATVDNCGGNANAIYALDMSGTGDTHPISIFETHGSGPAGSAATAIATTTLTGQIGLAASTSTTSAIYTQIPEGTGDVAGTYKDTVLSLAKDLKVKDYFTPSDPSAKASDAGITPMTFTLKGRDVVVAGSRSGRVYLLDGQSLGGPDHHTPLAQSEPAGGSLHGAFASFEDPDTNIRWIFAPVHGAYNGIVALRLEERDGKPVLTKAWTNSAVVSPGAPVVANGLVFVLASGESEASGPNGKPWSIPEREKKATHATLFVLDAANGSQLYSSGSMVSTFAHDPNLALANKRIYFSTHDNTVYALGFMADQPQLTGK